MSRESYLLQPESEYLAIHKGRALDMHDLKLITFTLFKRIGRVLQRVSGTVHELKK